MDSIEEAIKKLTPWEFFIDEARNGDASHLAAIVRDHGKRDDDPFPPFVWVFIADLIEGKAQVKRRKKLTAIVAHRRYIRERLVDRMVRDGMREAGRERDRNLRTRLTEEYCAYYGIETAAFARYKRLPKSRRK